MKTNWNIESMYHNASFESSKQVWKYNPPCPFMVIINPKLLYYFYKNGSKNMENSKSMPKMPIQIFTCYSLPKPSLKLLGPSITPCALW
jgi:hypothetical protein